MAYVGLVCGGAGTHTSLCCACLLSMFYGGHDGSGDADDHTPPVVGVLWRGLQVGDVFASMPSVPLRVRRMDWSPDGRGLVATAAYKEPQYVAPLISRESWAVNAAFVGHTKPVVAARFNRAMFRAVGGSDDGDAAASYCCCAFGGQDTAVTVWVTHLPRPLAVISNLFEDTVTDLAWCGCRGVAGATTNDRDMLCVVGCVPPAGAARMSCLPRLRTEPLRASDSRRTSWARRSRQRSS